VSLSLDTLGTLEDLLAQEVHVLRKILCNLTSEHQALVERKETQVYALLHERLDDMEVFETLTRKLGGITGEEANFRETLDTLDPLIHPENMELRSLHAQLVALYDAIQKQSDRTHELIKNYGNSLDDYICWTTHHPAPASLLSPCLPEKKVAIQVLEME
jgi:hypothetical protein